MSRTRSSRETKSKTRSSQSLRSRRSRSTSSRASSLASPSIQRLMRYRLSYTKLQVPNGLNDLLFSDIVPVPTTNEGAAATALYHLLALASKRLLKVEQVEAYGDVRSKLFLCRDS